MSYEMSVFLFSSQLPSVQLDEGHPSMLPHIKEKSCSLIMHCKPPLTLNMMDTVFDLKTTEHDHLHTNCV